jgi:autotransporter-associated beta strand protein
MKNPHIHLHAFLALAGLGLSASFSPAFGQATWTGNTGPAPALWSTGANWTGTAPTSSGSQALTFNPASLTGSSILSTSNDLSNFTATGITINNSTTAGNFTLAGNEITLGGDITTTGNIGSPTHLISLDMILNGNRTITSGSSATNVTVSGIISETGGARNLIKASTGGLTLSGPNTFTGTTFVNQGTLTVNSIADSGSSALGLGTQLNLGSATTSAGVLIYNSTGNTAATTSRTVNLAATTTGAGTITNNSASAGASLSFTASTFLNAATSGAKIFTLRGSNTGVNTFAGNISNGTGTLSFIKTDIGSWTLSGASTFTGQTSINQGTLTVTSIADSGSSALGLGTQVNFGQNSSPGILIYNSTGSTAATTSRTVNLTGTTGGATISNDSANALATLSFTGTFANPNAGTKNFTLGGSNTGANTFQSSIVNGGGTINLVKGGVGTWILSGTNTYTGATNVNAGKLIINGSTSSTSLVTVASGATLGGTGTVGGNTTISGTHNPGNSPGVQTFGSNLTYSGVLPSPVVNWELTGNTSTNVVNPNAIFDQIIVGGNLDFTNPTTLNLSFIAAGSNVLWSDTFWDASQSWTLYDVAGTTSNFGNLSLNTVNWLDSGSNLFSTTGGSFSLGQSGQDVILNYTFIPEPNVAALLGGLGMLVLLRRRRA